MILSEAVTLFGVFLLTLVMPGADFACVVRESVMYGRRAGILAAIGIGLTILFHVAYTVLGLGIVIAQSILAFTLIKWAGAAYLVFIGVMSLRAKAPERVEVLDRPAAELRSARRSFGIGVLTNLLNPKAALFFVSLFTVIVSHDTPAVVKAGYGVAMALMVATWFTLVAVFFTTPKVRLAFARFGRWINRVTGLVFLALGVRLALQRAAP